MAKKNDIEEYKKKLSMYNRSKVARALFTHPSFLSRLFAGKVTFTTRMRERFDEFLLKQQN